MLLSLTVKNFVVAQDVSLQFGPGLTAFLGETGAGKSVLVDALAVACGAKASYSKVRDPAAKAFVEAVFQIPDGFLAGHAGLRDFLGDERQLVLSVSITPRGTVLRKANGETMTVGMLKELTAGLVDIHSQGGSRELSEPEGRLELLDSFGRGAIGQVLGEYREAYGKVVEKEGEIAELKATVGKEDPDFLDFRIGEIERLKLEPEEIERDEKRLGELAAVAKARDALRELAPAVEALGQIEGNLQQGLEDLRGTSFDGAAQKAKDGLDELLEGLEQLQSDRDQDDPGEVDRLNQRLFELEPLRTKYGRTTKDILAALADLKAKRDSLGSYARDLEALQGQLATLEGQAKALAERLTGKRMAIAKEMSAKVSGEMADLALAPDGFRVALTALAGLGPKGQDGVDFLVRLNKGFPFQPLEKTASGGESSRIMLALKSVLNRDYPADVLVFDEIDTGISGNVAFKAGQKMHRLSYSSQVLCITHLPQVAAFGDSLVWVEKTDDGNASKAKATQVEKKGMADKIALLISGGGETKASLFAAEELIAQAHGL